MELPALANEGLRHLFGETLFPRLYTGPHEEGSVPFIQAFRLRFIGYASLGVVAALILVGILAERRGLAAAGAVAFFLPVFGHFALSMFFLAGLGLLRTIWMPVLEASYGMTGDPINWPFRLGEIALVPYMAVVYVAALVRLDLRLILPHVVMGLGLFLFILGTLAWFRARIGRRLTAEIWVYRFSRHPQYLGWILWSYGLMLYFLHHAEGAHYKISWGIPDSLPWLISSLVIVGVALLEEIRMGRTAGEEYESYRRRTPFMLPLPRLLSRVIAAPMRVVLRKEGPESGREVGLVLAIYAGLLILLSLGFVALGLPPHRRWDLFPYTIFPFR